MEFIDSHPVVGYKVRFANRIEITEAQAQLVKDDLTLVWLVRAHCQPPQYHPVLKDGGEDRYRFNIQSVDLGMPLEGSLRDQALSYLEHGADQGYLNFGVPTYPQGTLPETAGQEAQQQLSELTVYLLGIGELRDDETPLDAVRRLTSATAPATGPLTEDGASIEPQVADLVDAGLGDVQVVGSIYRNGHRPETQALIEEAFGSP